MDEIGLKGKARGLGFVFSTLIAGAWLLATPSFGVVMVEYNFNLGNGTNGVNVANQASATGFYVNSPPLVGPMIVNVPPQGPVMQAERWPLGAVDARRRYWGFTITAENAFYFDLTSLTFLEDTELGGPANWQVRWSLDNFSAPLGGGPTGPPGFGFSGQSVDLSGTPVFPGTVEFRIYGHNALDPNGHWRIDNVTLNGAELERRPAVPEPSAFALMGLAGLILGFRRFTRRK